MATVKIWKVSRDLRQVIRYTTDELKTNIDKVKFLDPSLEYIKDEFNSEEKIYISGINIDKEHAFKEMVSVKKKYCKTDGILGFHAYQSFKHGEVTPEEAHEIGLKFANEMWGDRFQVVVSTHLNTNCYHNHFVINSVSFVDGKKYYNNRTTYAEMRRLNDEICKEYGKSYLEEKVTKAGINYLNYQKKELTYNNYYKTAKEDIDIAISQAKTYSEFLTILKNMGYIVINRSGKLSIRGEHYKRNIRIERHFGEDYSVENIKKQIIGTYIPIRKTYHKYNRPTPDLFKILMHPKYNSFYGMFMRYSLILNNYPTYVKNHHISKGIKDDLKRLDEISREAIFLEENKIITESEFILLADGMINSLINLKNERESLWKEYKKVNISEKQIIKDKIDEISTKIKSLNDDVKMCEKIRLRKDKINENMKKIKEKEMVLDEHVK